MYEEVKKEGVEEKIMSYEARIKSHLIKTHNPKILNN